MSADNKEYFSTEDAIRLKELPEFREMKMRAEAAEHKLRSIYGSRLWKITKPLRLTRARFNQAKNRKRKSHYVFQDDSQEGLPVIDLVRNEIKIEAKNADLNSKNIALVAHFSKERTVSQSLNLYIKNLLENDYSVIVISACESEQELIFSSPIKNKVTIIRKPNIGYDFGSWAVAFDLFPELFNARSLILTNDSLVGPLSDISKIISELKNSDFDITGITDSTQLQYHIQSYLVHFNERAIQHRNIQNFLKSVVHFGLKNDIILKYELGLTRTAQLSGLYVGAIFPWNLIVLPDENPSLLGWQRLLELGFPFIKREAVRLATSFDKKLIKDNVKKNFSNSDWAIQEIKSIS